MMARGEKSQMARTSWLMASREFRETDLAKLAHTTVTGSVVEDSQLLAGGPTVEEGDVFVVAVAVAVADIVEKTSDHRGSRSKPLQQG